MRDHDPVRWLLACVGLISAVAAVADQDVERTLEVDPQGLVRIHSPRGDLKVEGWARGQVRVTGTVDDLADAFDFVREGKHTRIVVHAPRRNLNRGDGSDLTVWVPAASALTIDAASTDVDVESVEGDVAIRTVSGDVEVEDCGALTHIKTVSGDVDVKGGTGRLLVFSTGGDLDIDSSATDIFVDTMNGDIELQLGTFGKLRAQTVDGTLEIEGRLHDDGQLRATTVSSAVELELEEPVHAEVRASTMGEISNALTGDRPQRSGPGWVLHTRAGRGSAQVVLSSVDGEIEIR